MRADRAVTCAAPVFDDLDRYRWVVEQLLRDALTLDDDADVEAFFAFVIASHDRGDAAADCARRWQETRSDR
jgi:hypothetical protein